MLTAFAGLLLAIPGFVTDIIALVLLIPAIGGLLSGRALTPAQRPTRPGVVDLDAADWREERRPPPSDPRLNPPGPAKLRLARRGPRVVASPPRTDANPMPHDERRQRRTP